MARILISTLGTGDYKEARYKLNESTSDTTKFIQAALVQLVCSDWSQNFGDSIKVLCTSGAEQRHWSDLSAVLSKTDIDVQKVTIPIGSNENELWEIFQTIIDCFNEGDEVWFDLTHSFRSIPMLVLTAITYAKVLKHIEVRGLYYGAFEAKVEDTAPVFSLNQFLELQDWASASRDFLNFGHTDFLTQLLKLESQAILRDGRNAEAEATKNLAKGIEDYFSDALKKNHIEKIYEFALLTRKIESYKANQSTTQFPAFTKLFEKIAEKALSFHENEWENVFTAAEWCAEHGQIQNAYSILLEGVISIALVLIGKKPIGETKEVVEMRKMVLPAAELRLGNITTRDIIGDSDLAVQLSGLFDEKAALALTQLNQSRNGLFHGGTGSSQMQRDVLTAISDYLVTLREWYREGKGGALV